MPDPIPVERREVIEERANRDAFWICMALIAAIAIALVVAGIVAWNVRVILYPLMPRETAPARKTLAFTQRPAACVAPLVMDSAVQGTAASCLSSRLGRDGHPPMAGTTPAGGFSFPSRRVQS